MDLVMTTIDGSSADGHVLEIYSVRSSILPDHHSISLRHL